MVLDVVPKVGEAEANAMGLGLLALALIVICGVFCLVDSMVEQRRSRRVEERILRGEFDADE